jgi:cobalt/nickel transport protein
MRKLTNSALLGAAVVLSFAPVFMFQGKEFKATDTRNQTAIAEVQPDYKPWFEPIIKPSGGEVETFLFATQAAIGAGVTGYILGLYKGRTERRNLEESIDPIDDRSSHS